MSIKSNLGKLKIPKGILEAITKQGFDFLPITSEHARYAGDLKPLHQDPFDRMLIAQAQLEQFTILTVDTEIKRYQITCV